MYEYYAQAEWKSVKPKVCHNDCPIHWLMCNSRNLCFLSHKLSLALLAGGSEIHLDLSVRGLWQGPNLFGPCYNYFKDSNDINKQYGLNDYLWEIAPRDLHKVNLKALKDCQDLLLVLESLQWQWGSDDSLILWPTFWSPVLPLTKTFMPMFAGKCGRRQIFVWKHFLICIHFS